MTRIIRARLGRDFRWLVVPASNPDIAIPATTKALAQQYVRVFDGRVRQDSPYHGLVPEDFLHIRVTGVMRVQHGLPGYIEPPASPDGWHPYQRISFDMYRRESTEHRITTATVEDGEHIYWSARPEWHIRKRIEAAIGLADVMASAA